MKGFVLLYEFLATRKKCGFILSLVVPTFKGLAIFYLSSISQDEISDLISNILNVTGILLGFSISVLAIFITGGNKNIDLSKEYKIGVKIWKDTELMLYDRIIINLCYTIIIQGFILLTCFIFPSFIEGNYCIELRFISIIVAILSHVIFMILGVTLDLYLIVSKKK